LADEIIERGYQLCLEALKRYEYSGHSVETSFADHITEGKSDVAALTSDSIEVKSEAG